LLLVLITLLSESDLSFAAEGDTSYPFPIILPPFTKDKEKLTVKPEWGTCLFYLETLNVYVFNKKSKEPSGWGARIESSSDLANKFTFNDEYVKCIKRENKKQPFTITLDVEVTKPVEAKYKEDQTLFTVEGKIPLTLNFTTDPGYAWHLAGISTTGFKINGKGSWLSGELNVPAGVATEASMAYMGIGSSGDYNYGCSQTKSAVFETDKKGDYDVGVSFGNVQIQAYDYALNDAKDKVHFSHYTNDCVGTFSIGSLMGIVVALVLASVLMFGFLMLNSVQTVDRFDDPKQKQLIINAKD